MIRRCIAVLALLALCAPADARHRSRRHHHSAPVVHGRSAPAPEPRVALYRMTKTTAAVLGVTDASMLFSPYAQAAPEPRPHFSRVAPWAGALVW